MYKYIQVTPLPRDALVASYAVLATFFVFVKGLTATRWGLVALRHELLDARNLTSANEKRTFREASLKIRLFKNFAVYVPFNRACEEEDDCNDREKKWMLFLVPKSSFANIKCNKQHIYCHKNCRHSR